MRNYLVSTIKNRTRSILTLTVFVLMATLLLAGCSSSAKVSSDQNENKRKTKVKLPANFPEKFPIPPDGKLVAAKQDLIEGGATVYYATWEVDTPDQEIIDSYRRDLPANGWEIKNVSSGDSPDITFMKSGDIGDSHLRVATINKKHVIQILVYE